VIEDVLLRLYEAARRRGATAGARVEAPKGKEGPPGLAAPPAGRATLALALALTWLMKLDVVLFGGVRTGPFFGLLRPGRGA